MSALWAPLARLPVWGDLGVDRTTGVILDAAVLLIEDATHIDALGRTAESPLHVHVSNPLTGALMTGGPSLVGGTVGQGPLDAGER